MRELTYSEAAVEAVAEEMRRDPKIFYMSTDPIPSLLKEFGGGLRFPSDCRLAASDVRLRRHGSNRQPGVEDTLHVRGPGELPDPLSGGRRRRHPACRAALAVSLFHVHESRRLEDVPAFDAVRHEGAPGDRDPRQQSSHLFRVEPPDDPKGTGA